MKRRSVEEKLQAIKLVEAGNSARSVADKLHTGHHQIYEWLALYKEKGIAGLENKRTTRHNRLSYEEKCKIIREFENSELTLVQVSCKHGISSGTLSNWLCKMEEGGVQALARKPRSTINSMKRVPKEECEKENERLRKENERLRAEVLLLKKVRALVKEREAQNREIGRAPSKN